MKDQGINCPIWQAARATLALPDLFPPIEISQADVKQVYIGGAIGSSNPSNELIREFELQWKDEKIASLISMGAGHEGVIQAADSLSTNGLGTVLNRMVTDCERVALCLEDRFRDQNIYFRFSVEQGLQRRTDGIRTELGDIETHTKGYLQSGKTSDLIDELVESLSGDLEAPDYMNNINYFRQTMDRYVTNSRQILAEVRSEDERSAMNDAIALLESIRVSGFDSIQFLHIN
jgi:predicted acylesterase/phospholipase RssA